MAQKHPLRKFFNDVHLWLGIASGLVLFIVCLTGTLYTFRTEIERLVNPDKFYVEADAGSVALPADTIVTRLEKKLNGKITSLQVPADPTMTYQVSIIANSSGDPLRVRSTVETAATSPPRVGNKQDEKKASAGTASEARPKTYFVNPYTAGIMAEQGGGLSDFFSNVLKLHRWLLLENATGRVIVGAATIIFVFLILSGLVIWFPARTKNWKRGLKIRFSANWKTINHDLHNAFGFYAFLVLLVMALTGLCWSFEWYRDGLSKVLGAKVFKGRGEKPMQSGPTTDTTATVSLTAHIAKTNALFPYPGDIRVSLPAEALGAVSVNKNHTGFFAFSGPDKVQLDRFTGEALKTERFSGKRFNEKIADSIKPLHTGEIFGKFSKILYFLACLMATSLPVTGTFIWINKLKKKRRRNASGEEQESLSARPQKLYNTEIGSTINR